MFKQLKFKDKDSSNLIFCSDLHLNQNKQFLVDNRQDFTGEVPFDTTEGHDEWVWGQLEKYADGNNILFNLGDQVFRDPKGEVFDRLCDLNFKEHYILYGNHCSGLKQVYKKACSLFMNERFGIPSGDEWTDFEIYPLKYKNVTFVGNDLRIYVGKQEVHMSHFQKSIWDNMSDKRMINEHGHLSGIRPSLSLSGHSHSSNPETNIDSKFGKKLDVGVENSITYDDKFCFTFEEIKSIMENKDVVVIDHHNGQENPS